jgi:hypothetical protein
MAVQVVAAEATGAVAVVPEGTAEMAATARVITIPQHQPQGPAVVEEVVVFTLVVEMAQAVEEREYLDRGAMEQPEPVVVVLQQVEVAVLVEEMVDSVMEMSVVGGTVAMLMVPQQD